MNKKIIYGIFFISIFLLSTASMVQPARGYSFGVPDAGIGTTSEGEVKLYDEDEWEDHLGSQSSAADVFEADNDVVGAKSKQTIKDLEEDEDLISYEKDYAWKDDAIPGATDVYLTTKSLLDSSVLVGGAPGLGNGLTFLLNYSAYLLQGYGAFGPYILGNVTAKYNAANAFTASTDADQPTAAALLAIWGDKYDGALLTRDYWEKTEDAYKSNPDDKDYEVPFLADPRDWYNSWENTRGFKEGQQQPLKAMMDKWSYFYMSFFTSGIPSGEGVDIRDSLGNDKKIYEWFNDTIVQVINGSVALGVIAATGGPGVIGYPTFNAYVADGLAEQVGKLAAPNNNLTGLDALVGGSYNDSFYVHDLVAGLVIGIHAVLQGSWYTLEYSYPDNKAAHLLATLVSGQPVYVPQGDYMDKVIDTYDIDDDVLYRIPYVEGEKDINLDGVISALPVGTLSDWGYDFGGESKYVSAYVDVSAENGVVTFGIEYVDGQLDPGDVITGDLDPNELSDFEMVFVYGEYGGQDSTTVKDGNTEFWKSAGIDQIPGFEISIILGASALSIIGLIFVVMKKRKR